MKCCLGISNFLEEISGLSHSIVFLYFLHSSLKKAFLSFLAGLWNSAFRWIYMNGKGEEEVNWEIGIDVYILLYIKIDN